MHIELHIQQAAEDGNPMAISRILNPSKDEESCNGGSSRAVSDSLHGLSTYPAMRSQQSALDEREAFWSQKRLPYRAISLRRQYPSRRSSSFDHGYRNNRLPIHRYNHFGSPRQKSSYSTSPPAFSSQGHSHSHDNRGGSLRPPRSNKAYTKEQVDWIRFYHDDLNNAWKSLPIKFQQQFATETRDSNQCFSSRYYRDNQVPDHDNWEPIMGSDGRPRLMAAKVRQRQTPKVEHSTSPISSLKNTLSGPSPTRGLVRATSRLPEKSFGRMSYWREV